MSSTQRGSSASSAPVQRVGALQGSGGGAWDRSSSDPSATSAVKRAHPRPSAGQTVWQHRSALTALTEATAAPPAGGGAALPVRAAVCWKHTRPVTRALPAHAACGDWPSAAPRATGSRSPASARHHGPGAAPRPPHHQAVAHTARRPPASRCCRSPEHWSVPATGRVPRTRYRGRAVVECRVEEFAGDIPAADQVGWRVVQRIATTSRRASSRCSRRPPGLRCSRCRRVR